VIAFRSSADPAREVSNPDLRVPVPPPLGRPASSRTLSTG
jgi:hypothetical protein